MESIENLSNLYNRVKQELQEAMKNDLAGESKLLGLVDLLCFDKKFIIKAEFDYDLSQIASIFRFYEELLKNSFQNDKQRFEIEFKLYLLLIKVFTQLCNIFSKDTQTIKNIDSFFEILKESKNMLKFFLPLDKEHLNILNNLIGEQLYYFSHLKYHDINAHDLEYSLENYHLNLEKMFHGFDLSKSSNFGNKELTTEELEFAILKNNASFLILTLIFKIYKFKNKEAFENKNFIDIMKFYKDNFYKNENNKEFSIKEFQSHVLEDFSSSSLKIKKIMNHNVIKDKLEILRLFTDEYKQLIDIITKIDFQDLQ